MKKYLSALAAVAFTTLASFAEVTGGDIYSIDLTRDYNGIIPTEENPLVIGQAVTVRVRLINRSYAGSSGINEWMFQSQSAYSAFAPAKLGLMLGGKQVFADFMDSKVMTIDEYQSFTDFYFTYTVKPGDLALPAHLMSTDGVAANNDDATDYAIQYCNLKDSVQYWKLANNHGDECVFHFCDASKHIGMEPPNRCIDGTGLGIYVKTVDFDTNYFEEPATIGAEGIWRKLYRGMSTALPSLPTVKVEGNAAEAAVMYIWVVDTEIADVLAADKPQIIDGRHVITLPLAAGATTATFKLQGKQNGTTKVRMSASRELSYDKAGDVIEDWVERTIIVDDPPDPYVMAELQNPAGESLEKNTVTLSPEYENYVAMMKLTLLQEPSADLTVTLVPELDDGDIFEDGLLGLSLTTEDTPWNNEDVSFTVKPGDPLTQLIYVYAKGTTTKLSTKGVKFTVYTEGAPEYDNESGKHSSTLLVKYTNPTLVKPAAGDTITDAMAGKNYSLDIAVSDARKYMVDAAAGDSAYTVYYKVEAPGTEGEWSYDDAVYLDDADSGEATISVPFDIEGECNLLLYVLSPSGKKSQQVSIPVTVAAPKRATVTLDRVNGVYAEGETAYVNFHLTQKYKSELYAFLVPQDDETREKFETDISSETPNITGFYIGPNETDAKIPTEVRVIDGKAIARYQVFMCTTKNYSKTKSGGYIGDVFTISATNVVPRITKVSMGGAAVKNGKVEKAVAMDVEKGFTITVDEPGIFDLNATGDDAFRTEWKFGNENWISVDGNPNLAGTELKHKFTSPGEQTVLVRCQDKDMRKLGLWTEEIEFTVTVLDMPKIVITPVLGTTTFYEDQNKADQSMFEVSLTAAPEFKEAGKKLKINLEVTPLGAAPVTDCVLSRKYVEFGSGDSAGRSFYLQTLDGTIASMSGGFRITASVDTTDLPEGKDDEGKVWDLADVDVTILNRNPSILAPAERLDKDGEPLVSTAQINTDMRLTWAITDVAPDKKGMTVTWETNEGQRKNYVQHDLPLPPDTEETTYMEDVMAGTHHFYFTSSGDKTVTITITDKDGGFDSRTFNYTVEASKQADVTAHGPGAGTTAANGLSMKYDAAPGIGAGRVDATSKTAQSIVSWTANFTVGVAESDLALTATGYSVGDINTSIDQNGNLLKGGAAYRYNLQPGLGAEGFDSFLYAWLCNNTSSEGGATEQGAFFAPAKTGKFNLPLPMQALSGGEGSGKDGKQTAGYATQHWEALFSREFYKTDNCGDINLDGIPDIFTSRYDFGIMGEDGQLTGDEIRTKLDRFNDDEDYFPTVMTAGYASFVPDLSNTWVTAGRAFTARYEIRGYGEGLNDSTLAVFPDGVKNPCAVKDVVPDRQYTDPTIDKDSSLALVEYLSFKDWCDKQGLDVTDSNNWKLWSPERPTDPTYSDTDGDELPDGYEYYFWYKAHVGYLDVVETKDGPVTNLVHLTGRKYDPVDPCHPITITSQYIEETYDPIRAGAKLAEIDSDNDGLIDLLEFTIGTNPFDYDTDGDGLPDGWEVMISKTDPLVAGNDGAANPDGDMMASAIIQLYPITVTYADDTARARTNKVWATKRPLVEDDGTGVMKITEICDLYDGILYHVPDAYVLGAQIMKADDEKIPDAVSNLNVVEVGEKAEDVTILHWQVMTMPVTTVWVGNPTIAGRLNGFDPRTGWNNATDSRRRLNTANYSNYDEFMSMAFFVRAGLYPAAKVTPTPNRTLAQIWAECATNPNDADSDHDNMPDGWELYIMPASGPDNIYSPLYDFGLVADPMLRDPDNDGLDFVQEFCGVESCAVYAKCETIVNPFPRWQNKTWPTDPWNGDTDGDGLRDGEEQQWIFGTAVHKNSDYLDCVEGGGLNPNSWDTDLDGLPDAWEIEFAGTMPSEIAFEGATTDTTATTDGTNDVATATNTTASVNIITGPLTNDGMDPTADDAMLDYDHDGLMNWQEYLVGSMRCWRYDDLSSPWENMAVDGEALNGIFNPEDGNYQALFDALTNPWKVNPQKDDEEYAFQFNPGLTSGTIEPGLYFSCCTNFFDGARGVQYIFKDGYYHDLKDRTVKVGGQYYNRWTYYALQNSMGSYSLTVNGGAVKYPVKYISCDPRLNDTDGDGMDDYYELFHGLNPLLGMCEAEDEGAPRDIVYEAWGGDNAWSAKNCFWLYNMLGWHYNATIPTEPCPHLKGSSETMDFVQFPWLAGLPEADVDGDNIRNQQESILPNVQAAATFQHLDPTPLWLTDSSYWNSLTTRCYQPGGAPASGIPYMAIGVSDPDDALKNGYFELDGRKIYFDDFPWLMWDSVNLVVINTYAANKWTAGATVFDFEENEGYDSDHDFLSDYEESQALTKPASDPQDHDEPVRHQAMYFNGRDAFLQTPLQLEWAVAGDSGEIRQNFLYYTVEAWVKADEAIVDKPGLYTVVERAIWTGEANGGDESYLRKNFLIGLNNGRWYTKFDSTGTDKNQPVEISDGPKATTEWTHLAASYGPSNDDELDGKVPMALKFYVNGELVKTVKTAIQPEHGATAITINQIGELNDVIPGAMVNDKPVISTIVGASTLTMFGVVFDFSYQTGMPIPTPTFEDYSNYFKGYIDEVRIWDGARKASEIAADVENKVRYSTELALANREAVYKVWADGGLRSVMSTAEKSLPAQLMCHWSFDHLPGAVDVEDVMNVPAGFATDETQEDAKARWSRPINWGSPWWKTVAVRSTVYSPESDPTVDACWIPWINNTVTHLPLMDGTTSDSVYWSEDYAGYLAAHDFGYSSFGFPRTHEVYSKVFQTSPLQDTRWNLVATNGENALKYRFTNRNRYAEGGDLLPFGGAFPKRISAAEGGMWDAACAADAWAETGVDVDNNALPDWWEEYARKNYMSTDPGDAFGRNTTVTYDGNEMPAWEAYKRDLARGMLPGGEYDADYADTRDADHDFLPDWWEDMYGVNTRSVTDTSADPDGDGLSNLQEYLISEVFRYAVCRPDKAKTNDRCLDRFLKVGELYLGEVFTDHDQMDDVWELNYDGDYVNCNIYDPLEDKDNDGWSNYAEFRAGTDPTRAAATGIDGFTCFECPIPFIRAKVVNSTKRLINAPVVFKAWNERYDADMESAPDATWTLGGGLAQDDENGNSGRTSATSETVVGSELVDRQKFIGQKPKGTRTFYLPGGTISRGSVKLCFLDKTYSVVTYDQTLRLITDVQTGDPDNAVWFYGIIDNDGKLIRTGNALDDDEVVVGSVDYETGRVTIDFDVAEISGRVLADPASAVDVTGGENKTTTETKKDDDATTYHLVDLDKAYVLMQWKSMTGDSAETGLYYLSDPDPTDGMSLGHLREGKNTFICFVDDDGDGEYTPGELFGFVRDVDVGWFGASFTVDVTETHPVFGRIDLKSILNDREAIYGIDSGNYTNLTYSGASGDESSGIETSLSGGRKQHIRIDRVAINGIQIGLSTNQVLVSDRIVMDKWIDLEYRPYLTEADILNGDQFDIDWDHFDEIAKDPTIKLRFEDVYDVSYRIVVDNTTFVHPAVSNRMLNVAFTRHFDDKGSRNIPYDLKTTVAYGAHPTFKWTMGEFNSYTAFKLRINGTGGVVYESPMTLAPAKDKDGYYVWTAPFSVGDLISAGHVISPVENYTWQVSMYNAKFKTDAWSEAASLRTAVDQRQITDNHEYGAIDVRVKYTGPVAVLSQCENTGTLAGKVRVQAFSTPDFAGVPAAECCITDRAKLTDVDDTGVNGTLFGLKAGTYYVRAYIDSNGNHEKDEWESWGGGLTEAVVSPTADVSTVEVYIEDADTDGDWMPDAWEFVKNGDLKVQDALVDPKGEIVLATANFSQKKNGTANTEQILSVSSLMFFKNLNSLGLLLGLPVGADAKVALATIASAVRKEIVGDSVRITGLDIDTSARQVVLKFGGELEDSEAAKRIAPIYTIPSDTTISVRVLWRNSLGGEDWTCVKEYTTTVSSDFAETIRFDLGDEIDLTNGFFKVDVVEFAK